MSASLQVLGNSARSANWMRTLEFAIWERAQTSALRSHCSHLLTRFLWPDASIRLRAAARSQIPTDGVRTCLRKARQPPPALLQSVSRSRALPVWVLARRRSAAPGVGLPATPSPAKARGRCARKSRKPFRPISYLAFGGLIMICAPGVPGYISHGAPGAPGDVESPVDSGVAFGTYMTQRK